LLAGIVSITISAALGKKFILKGWAPIIILLLILSGMQMLILGIIGEYLWRTLDQTRDRPLFLIYEIIE
jgi:dolichol-phosphate mannosyltransferase